MRAIWKQLVKTEPRLSTEYLSETQSGDLSFHEWISSQVGAEPYWFQRIELPGGLVTPRWNDPKTEDFLTSVCLMT